MEKIKRAQQEGSRIFSAEKANASELSNPSPFTAKTKTPLLPETYPQKL